MNGKSLEKKQEIFSNIFKSLLELSYIPYIAVYFEGKIFR